MVFIRRVSGIAIAAGQLDDGHEEFNRTRLCQLRFSAVSCILRTMWTA